MSIAEQVKRKGFNSKVFTYKTVSGLELKLDVFYPLAKVIQATPVLIHFHGGFLILGDRYSFFPHWLVNACAFRNWIFVSPDYRLIPETTAHSSVDDAVDAYSWVLKSLSTELGIEIGPIILAGSSAGAYLALTATSLITPKPKALLLMYGMLDPLNQRYTTKGDNIFGQPTFDTAPIIEKISQIDPQADSNVLTGYPIPSDPSKDFRFSIVAALHIEALLPDYMTGISGLSEAIAAQGSVAIPADARRLFAASFSLTPDFPPTMLVHGKNDTAVPFALSEELAQKLQVIGVPVTTEFPEDAPHGFDTRVSEIDIDKFRSEEISLPAFAILRKAVNFLNRIID